jgi:uncharacterized protein
MRNFFALLCLALLPLNSVRAEGFLLWQAQKDGQTINLLANIPVMSSDLVAKLAPEVHDAFKSSKLVIFESDPDVERRKEGRNQIINAALYPEGDDLMNHLPTDTKRAFQKICREYNIQGHNLIKLRPWMAAQNLLQMIYVRAQVRLGDDLEKYFYRRVTEDEKPLAFLQSPDDTINMFDAMNEKDQIRLLDKSMHDAQTLTNFLTRVEAAWKASDMDAATGIINESFADYPDVRKALFQSRHAKWADELQSQAGIEEQVFALVSLSSLVGPDNLLDQLKARGYLIAQVVPE